MILLDLDRFKVINESVGHAVGDRLLAAVGQRLVGSLRPSDTVARFGGDEFGIILDPVVDADDARRIAERIGAELRTPFPMGGREWFISASLGIAVGRPGPRDARTRCSARPRSRWSAPRATRPSATPCSSRRCPTRRWSGSTWRTTCGARIERGELRVHYQPLVDLDHATGSSASRRSSAGSTPSAASSRRSSFIPLAEETGLIMPLGRWVLETACRQATRWRDARPDGPQLLMSVNLSARQFVQPDLVDQVDAILTETGLDPTTLELEITESVVMDQSEVGHPDAPPAARHGRPARPRRLRHRLFVAGLPEAPAARHDQDRPDVRGRARRRARTARSSRR